MEAAESTFEAKPAKACQIKQGMMREPLTEQTRLLGIPSGAICFTPSIMSHSEKALDYLEQQIPGLSAAAVDVAFWEALAAGQKVIISDEDGIYEVSPDGTRTFIKAIEKPLVLPVGTRVKIA